MSNDNEQGKVEASMANGFPLKAADLPNFVRQHSDWMMAVAFRILQDQSHAEDAVQVAFTKVLSKMDTFEGRSALRTWMHRIVANEALMILRKIKRQNEHSIDDLLPVFDAYGCRIDSDSNEIETPEVLLSRRETHDQIRDAIMALPDKYRIVLCLRDIEGFSTSETSVALEMSEANVKVRLHRARAALKTLLETNVKEQKL